MNGTPHVSPPEDDLYCPVCRCDSADCEQPDDWDEDYGFEDENGTPQGEMHEGHRGEWVDKAEYAADAKADFAYDWWNDEERL